MFTIVNIETSLRPLHLSRSEVSQKVKAESIEDFIILHSLNLLNIDVEYSPTNDVEEMVVKYVTCRDPEEKTHLRRLLREKLSPLSDVALMLRLCPWEKAVKHLMSRVYEVLRRGEACPELVFQLAKYHLHVYSSKLLRQLAQQDRTRAVAVFLAAVLEIEPIPIRNIVKVKISDVHRYVSWTILETDHPESRLLTIFRSSERNYLLAGPDIVSDEARMTMYMEKVEKLDNMYILQERGRRAYVLYAHEDDVKKVRVSGRDIVVKCRDIDTKFTQLENDNFVLMDDLCIFIGQEISIDTC